MEFAVIREQYGEILRRLEQIDGRIAEQNGRVRKLEEWRWKAAGAVAMAMFILSIALKFTH